MVPAVYCKLAVIDQGCDLPGADDCISIIGTLLHSYAAHTAALPFPAYEARLPWPAHPATV